jgi:hypothetical protein
LPPPTPWGWRADRSARPCGIGAADRHRH